MPWGDLVTDPVQLIVTVAATITALTVLLAAGRKTFLFLHRVGHFLDDWQGEPERPGVPRRPGVMEQLGDHSQRLKVVEDRSAQLTPNGGNHLLDKVNEIDRKLTEHVDMHTPPRGIDPVQ